VCVCVCVCVLIMHAYEYAETIKNNVCVLLLVIVYTIRCSYAKHCVT